jgi:hypothetical protein
LTAQIIILFYGGCYLCFTAQYKDEMLSLCQCLFHGTLRYLVGILKC